MKKRDSKGRFSKNEYEENNNFTLAISTFKSILKWISLIIVLFPWIIIIYKFNLFEKMEEVFDFLYNERNEETTENGKKSGLFY